MNIENITKLGSQLKQIGFNQMEFPLLKRICFRIASFQLQQSVEKVSHQLSFSFHFEKDKNSDWYSLLYYDVSLHKQIILDTPSTDADEIAALENQMTCINWKNFLNEGDKRTLTDKQSWETEAKAEQVTEKLIALCANEYGKTIAGRLIKKYWVGTLPDEIVNSISDVKYKPDITQRFYASGDNLITIDEAYRFLQNKWIEKQMQQKVKESKISNPIGDSVETNKRESKGTISRKKANK